MKLAYSVSHFKFEKYCIPNIGRLKTFRLSENQTSYPALFSTFKLEVLVYMIATCEQIGRNIFSIEKFN